MGLAEAAEPADLFEAGLEGRIAAVLVADIRPAAHRAVGITASGTATTEMTAPAVVKDAIERADAWLSCAARRRLSGAGSLRGAFMATKIGAAGGESESSVC
jgi:hypothetical protein